jgi:hypothetical protein
MKLKMNGIRNSGTNGSDRLSRLRFLNRDAEEDSSSKKNHDEYWSIAHRYRNLP